MSTTSSVDLKPEKKSKKKLLQEKERDYKKNKLFRRIEADIKDRDRRRIPGNGTIPILSRNLSLLLIVIGKPEEYVDKSRVIPVSLGPPDIRTSMLKQRTFLSKSVFFMQEEQQGHKIFVEQAAHEMHKGSYDLALVYLKKAIRVIATCKKFLIM